MLSKTKFFYPVANFFSRASLVNSLPPLSYDELFDQIFENEYSRLAEHRHVYLDHSEVALHGKSQLEKHLELLNLCVMGNPSGFKIPNVISAWVETTRKAITAHFQAYDYHCIFTPNTARAIKVIGNRFPFDATSQLLMLADNHNTYMELTQACNQYNYSLLQGDLTINASQLSTQLRNQQESEQKLFVYPAQSELSGVQHDLNWIQEAQKEGWDVLLDADVYTANSSFSLKKVQPDFVTLSFHKMFGYPSDIGCLLVKQSKIEKLKEINQPNDLHNVLENGSIDYFQVPAIKIGLDFIAEIGIERIESRMISLSKYLCDHLRSLKHSSGVPLVRIYGPEDRDKMGGTLLMNFYDVEGTQYPFKEIASKAHEESISIRARSFGNSGLSEIIQQSSVDDGMDHSVNSKEECKELLRLNNSANGAIRVSVGISTRKKDLDAFIQFVQSLTDIRL